MTSGKVKDGSLLLKDFKAGQLPAGATGAAGLKGEVGATGEKGDVGPVGPLPDVLPSGRTLTGRFAVAGHQTAASDFVSVGALSFAIPLAGKPTAEVVSTSTPTTNCPGTLTAPTAAPGYLCFYVPGHTGGTGLSASTSALGATFLVSNVAANTEYQWIGSWAVTAG